MNRLNIKLLAAALISFLSFSAFSQNDQVKIGYTNVDYILSLMPESKQVESQLKDYKKQLDKQLESKVQEFQNKYKQYESGASMMNDVVRADKEKELQNLQRDIEDFRKNAQSALQKKEVELLEPLLTKIENTIKEVAKENGYTYVFNSDAGFGTTPILLYFPEKHNVSDKVLKKMGVTPPEK